MLTNSSVRIQNGLLLNFLGSLLFCCFFFVVSWIYNPMIWSPTIDLWMNTTSTPLGQLLFASGGFIWRLAQPGECCNSHRDLVSCLVWIIRLNLKIPDEFICFIRDSSMYGHITMIKIWSKSPVCTVFNVLNSLPNHVVPCVLSFCGSLPHFSFQAFLDFLCFLQLSYR